MKEVRARNNQLWMELTKLAMARSEAEAKTVMQRIHDVDHSIGVTVKAITKAETGAMAAILFDHLELLRATNNHNWMDLLRLTWRVAMEGARELLDQIDANDEEVRKLMEELYRREVEK